LNVKIHSLFCGNNSWTIALRQMNFGKVKDHGHTYKFYFNHYFASHSFEIWRCEILRLCWYKRWTTLFRIL
jgi:hypothetical protein